MEKIAFNDIRNIYELPLVNLVDLARSIHRVHFPDGEIHAASLLSIKTGGCQENCSYCPQSAHYNTGVKRTKLMDLEAVIFSAKTAKQNGASRFCMGAAWRSVKDGPDLDHVIEIVKAVKSLGLEVCCTLGMLTKDQATRLKNAGLYAYNHNIDTSKQYYSKIIQTRSYEDRLRTIQNVREAGLTVCTGGILGMGESTTDRISFIHQLVSFEPQPESITINTLVPFDGTPLERSSPIEPFDVIRVIATLRVFAPKAIIRLSAGRLSLSDESQFLCFLSGANSMFLGEKLLTSPNPSTSKDHHLLKTLGLHMKGNNTHEARP